PPLAVFAAAHCRRRKPSPVGRGIPGRVLVLGIRRGGGGLLHHFECHFDARDSRREHCRILDVFDAASKEAGLTPLISPPTECAQPGAPPKKKPRTRRGFKSTQSSRNLEGVFQDR